MLRFYHKISSSTRDWQGPYQASESDFASLEAALPEAPVRRARRFLRWCFPPALALAGAASGLACATAEQKAVAAEAAYTTELARCVDRSETITEARACRAAAREKWGVAADAGAGTEAGR